jgi:hypothetical protein
MTPIEKTPFFSPRNVPLWAGLVMVAIFGALIFFGHGA